MNIYGQYAITPEDHTVSHPERAEQTYSRQGVKEAFSYLMTGVIVSGVTLGIHLWLNEGVTEDRYDGIKDWIATLVWGTSGLIAIVMLPFMIYCGLRCLLVSFFKPDLRTAASTLKAFLNSTKHDLNIRAYNLLTDQARQPGKVSLTNGVETLTKLMPDIDINDFESFDRFWTEMDTLSWNYKTRRVECKPMDNDATTFLRVPVTVTDPKDDDKKIRFNVEFVAVRRRSRWYLANGFVWPV